MAVAFLDATSSDTSACSIPAVADGSLLIAVGFENNVAPPATPSGWNLIGTAARAGASLNVCWKIKASGDTGIDFVNATASGVGAWSGHDPADPIGVFDVADANGSAITIPPLSLEVTDGTSWAFATCGHRNAPGGFAPISGMAERWDVDGGGNDHNAGFDTDGGVASFGGGTITSGGSANWAAMSVEIKAAPATGEGPHEGSASGSLLLGGSATGSAPAAEGVPDFRSLTSGIVLGGEGTDLVLDAPSGLTADDAQLVVITHSSGDDPIVSADPGWTRILQYDNPHAAGANGENERIEVWTAKGPTGTATFSKTNTITSMHGIRVAYTGGVEFTGADVLPQNDALSRDDVHPVPEQTTTEANTLLISIVGAEERSLPVVTDWTAPSGWTERYNVTGDEGGDHIHLNLADLLVASPTTVSGATWTSTENSWSSNVSLLLEPTTATVPNSGSVSGGLELSGSATGAASHEGSISGALVLDGTAAGSAGHSGSAAGSLALGGSATGAADHAGSVSGGLLLDGTATSHADHAGATSGALVVNGSATGEARHEGSTSGGLVLSGSAAGDSPSVGGASGSASGSLLLDGSATGATAHEGHASGALALDGQATGATVHEGAASGSIVLSSEATGSARHAGSVSGGLLLSGSAVGNAPGGVVRDLGIIATEPPAVALATEAPTTVLTAAEPGSLLDTLTPASSWATQEPTSLTPWETAEAALTATTTEPTDEWETLEPAL